MLDLFSFAERSLLRQTLDSLWDDMDLKVRKHVYLKWNKNLFKLNEGVNEHGVNISGNSAAAFLFLLFNLNEAVVTVIKSSESLVEVEM